MRVLYVSKALATAAYRDKVHSLAAHVAVRAVAPNRWQPAVEAPERLDSTFRLEPVLFPGRNHLHLYRRPRRILEEVRPDLVHIDEEPYSAVTFQLLRYCRMFTIPVVFFAWQNVDKRLPLPFGAMRAHVFRHVAGAIAGTERAAQVLRHAGYVKPLAIIPQFGVNTRCFAPNPEIRVRVRTDLGFPDPRTVIVGFAGRLVPEKGLSDLFEAVRHAQGIQVVLIGDGPERRSLERLAWQLGMARRVRFVRRVPSLEVAQWLNALDIAVLPSRTTHGWVEQFGRFLVEAMACGVPVVGSDSGEIPHVIGDAGLVVPEGDVSALAATVARLAGAPALRAELGRRGRKRVLSWFTNEQIVERTVEFYNAVLGREGAAVTAKPHPGSPQPAQRDEP